MALPQSTENEEETYRKDITEKLEAKITDLCESVNGVKNVHVMITVETSDIDTLIIPQVRGVAIVCDGGNSATVRKTLTELVSAALGISTARISVAGGK